MSIKYLIDAILTFIRKAPTNAKKAIKWIKSPTKQASRSLKSGIKKTGRVAAKYSILSRLGIYLSAALISTYATISIFTPASALNPTQVIDVAKNCGIVNTMTGGWEKVLINYGKVAWGNAQVGYGELTKRADVVASGKANIESADLFFVSGMGAFTSDGSYLGNIDVDGILNFSFDDFIFGVKDSAAKKASEIDFDSSILDSIIAIDPIDNSGSLPLFSLSDPEELEYLWSDWDYEANPNYYMLIDEPVSVDVSCKAGAITYGGLDELGRTTRVVGNITMDMIEESAGWRCDFANDVDRTLSGWGHNAKVTLYNPSGKTTSGYFWNRSHLIADSLGGYNHVYKADGTIDQSASRSETRNLITGTRHQNVGGNDGKGGMAYFENMALSYIKSHPSCSVWYSAEPIYSGDELVPRGVLMKLKSCDGGIDVCGFVYNGSKGYTINYNDGTFYEK